ncbi:CCC motif membrane protein [Maribacter sp. 2307ULW6-5]|uniref:CCC motif membrane protein n=1 Tax=Maribacter sp. 2307ULW6-5 TaxID=3386275 RepID=UPI0039BC2A3F
MEEQKLPNVTIAIILGILSYLCCCISGGLGGILLSGIALFLVNKDTKLYQQNPDVYSNFSTLKTARIVAIIGLVLGILTLFYVVFTIVSMGGWEAYMEQTKEMYEEMGIEFE